MCNLISVAVTTRQNRVPEQVADTRIVVEDVDHAVPDILDVLTVSFEEIARVGNVGEVANLTKI